VKEFKRRRRRRRLCESVSSTSCKVIDGVMLAVSAADTRTGSLRWSSIGTVWLRQGGDWQKDIATNRQLCEMERELSDVEFEQQAV